MKNLYWRFRGWWRLKFGFCPYCDSSPPLKKCPVCDGSYSYGHDLTKQGKNIWKKRFIEVLKGSE